MHFLSAIDFEYCLKMPCPSLALFPFSPFWASFEHFFEQYFPLPCFIFDGEEKTSFPHVLHLLTIVVVSRAL